MRQGKFGSVDGGGRFAQNIEAGIGTSQSASGCTIGRWLTDGKFDKRNGVCDWRGMCAQTCGVIYVDISLCGRVYGRGVFLQLLISLNNAA